MRRLSAQFGDKTTPGIHRVVSQDQLAGEWRPNQRFLVHLTDDSAIPSIERLLASGLSNVSWVIANGLEPGTIIQARPDKKDLTVAYHDTDQHHALFLTNRCNSYCLMCSQPPTNHDDPWLVDEAIEIVRHIGTSPQTLGITGGEPLLLGSRLRKVIETIALHHPSTQIEVLSNGRLFSEPATVRTVLQSLETQVSWLIPLYGHADFLHDFVVQAKGAFEQTLDGLLALQEHQQPIQLRIVLIHPILEILPELCTFIARNLPFVREVALMGCEPIGFALANREQCEVDLAEWHDTLLLAVRSLQRHQIPYLLMNTPLCALPQELWPAAHRSISDWKAVYATECTGCTVQDRCSGLFAWHERGWKPTKIRPIQGAEE